MLEKQKENFMIINAKIGNQQKWDYENQNLITKADVQKENITFLRGQFCEDEFSKPTMISNCRRLIFSSHEEILAMVGELIQIPKRAKKRKSTRSNESLLRVMSRRKDSILSSGWITGNYALFRQTEIN